MQRGSPPSGGRLRLGFASHTARAVCDDGSRGKPRQGQAVLWPKHVGADTGAGRLGGGQVVIRSGRFQLGGEPGRGLITHHADPSTPP